MELTQVPTQCQPVQQTHNEVVKREKVFIPLGGGKGVTICRYKQKLYVNIRNYSADKDGRLKSTKRGILLTLDEWKKLKKNMKQVDQDLKQL